MNIHFINEEDYSLAFETMVHLRTHLSKDQFISQVKQQTLQGYKLIGLKQDHKIVALAGYRYCLFLAYGKFLYCDDLITHPDYRKKGYAEVLLDFMFEEAKKNQCKSFQLDSGVHRFEAHRQYIKFHMDITSHHFVRLCN